MDEISEICSKEQGWIEQINSGLMTAVYLKYALEPFYMEKYKQFGNTNSRLLSDVRLVLNSIILEIEKIYEKYRTPSPIGQNEFIEFSKMFLTNHINSVKTEEVNFDDLKGQIMDTSHKVIPVEAEDYVYEDFPEHTSRRM